MEGRLENIFCCRHCGFWFMREHEGAWNQCQFCYWRIKPRRSAILTVQAVVIMMARELEELMAA